MNLFPKTPARSNRFLPQIEALEDRQLLSTVLIPHGPPTPIKAQGGAFQDGSVLHLVLERQVGNEATLSDDGRGDVTVEWNGHTPPTFHGVHEVVIDSLGRHDTIKYNLTGNFADGHEEVDVRLASSSSKFIRKPGGDSVPGLEFHVEAGADKDGTVFQFGSTLFLALSGPAANRAVIQDDGAGNITVERNGHTPATFHGVSQFFIDSLGRQDAICYMLKGNVTKAHEVNVRLDSPNSTFTPKLGSFRTDGLTFHVETPAVPPQPGPGGAAFRAVDAFFGHGGFGQGQQSNGPVSATIGSATGGAGAGKVAKGS